MWLSHLIKIYENLPTLITSFHESSVITSVISIKIIGITLLPLYDFESYNTIISGELK